MKRLIKFLMCTAVLTCIVSGLQASAQSSRAALTEGAEPVQAVSERSDREWDAIFNRLQEHTPAQIADTLRQYFAYIEAQLKKPATAQELHEMFVRFGSNVRMARERWIGIATPETGWPAKEYNRLYKLVVSRRDAAEDTELAERSDPLGVYLRKLHRYVENMRQDLNAVQARQKDIPDRWWSHQVDEIERARAAFGKERSKLPGQDTAEFLAKVGPTEKAFEALRADVEANHERAMQKRLGAEKVEEEKKKRDFTDEVKSFVARVKKILEGVESPTTTPTRLQEAIEQLEYNDEAIRELAARSQLPSSFTSKQIPGIRKMIDRLKGRYAAEKKRLEELAIEKKRQAELADKEKRDQYAAEKKRHEERVVIERLKQEKFAAEQKRQQELDAAEKQKQKELAAIEKQRQEELAAEQKRQQELDAEKKRQTERAAREITATMERWAEWQAPRTLTEAGEALARLEAEYTRALLRGVEELPAELKSRFESMFRTLAHTTAKRIADFMRASEMLDTARDIYSKFVKNMNTFVAKLEEASKSRSEDVMRKTLDEFARDTEAFARRVKELDLQLLSEDQVKWLDGTIAKGKAVVAQWRDKLRELEAGSAPMRAAAAESARPSRERTVPLVVPMMMTRPAQSVPLPLLDEDLVWPLRDERELSSQAKAWFTGMRESLRSARNLREADGIRRLLDLASIHNRLPVTGEPLAMFEEDRHAINTLKLAVFREAERTRGGVPSGLLDRLHAKILDLQPRRRVEPEK